MSVSLSTIERAVLQRIQQDFPLHPDPYGEIARRVGCRREEVYAAVERLRKRGIIRRIGGSFNARSLGHMSLLVAARVDADCLEEVAARINRYPEVTHNYARDGRHNLWFTVIAENTDRLEALLADVRRCSGVRELHLLPAQRTFKIRVDFPFQGGCDGLE